MEVAASPRTKEHRAERRMNFRGSVVAHVAGPAARFIKTRRLPRRNEQFFYPVLPAMTRVPINAAPAIQSS